jgi:hypothetical protein
MGISCLLPSDVSSAPLRLSSRCELNGRIYRKLLVGDADRADRRGRRNSIVAG